VKSRGKADATLCPISTMQDLYDIVKESDRVVTF
jgi:sulfur relay (sulfurtransferase) complex TusBCD TusD component (DsrE family)